MQIKRLGIEKASCVMGCAKVAECEQTWQHSMLALIFFFLFFLQANF